MRHLRFANCEIDLDAFELRREGEPLPLNGKPLDLLIYLARHPERVISRDELLAEIWDGRTVSPSTVPTAILEIRRVLGDSAENQRVIASVRGRGYRFVAEVSEASASGHLVHGVDGPLQFVGRVSEMDLLETLHRNVRQSGRGRSVSISGPAGIGKTRLTHEFIARQSRSRPHFTARCSAIEGAPPYWPFVQLLRLALSHTPSPNPKLQAAAERLSDVHPEILRDRVVATEPADAVDRFSLFGLWLEAIAEIARSEPTTLVIEDIHLADNDSLDLLSCLAEEIDAFPILLITTRRPLTLDDRATRRLAEIAGYDSAVSLELNPLTVEDTRDLLANEERGTELLAESLASRSGGVPFYISQILRYLRKAEPEGRLDFLSLALPDVGNAIVARQLSDLPTGTRGVLAFAALIGDRFAIPLIADATQRPLEAVCEALVPSMRAGIVVEHSDGFEFEHSLLREALAATLDPAERKRNHMRIAHSLMQADGASTRAAQIADQLAQALPLSSPEDIVHFSSIAAREAEARFAFATAARYHALTLEAFDRINRSDPAERGRLMRALAKAVLYEGDRDRARALLFEAAELARRSDAPDALAACALQIAPDFLSIEVGTHDKRHISLIEEALAAQPLESTALKSRLLACLSQALRWTSQPDEVLRLAKKACTEAESVTDPTAEIAALAALSEALHGPARAPERLRQIARLEAAAQAASDVPATLLAYTRALTAHLELGDIQAVEAMNDLYRQLSDDVKVRQYRWYPFAHDATLALMRGELDAAERLSNQFRSIAGSNPDQNCLQTFAAHHALRLVERDRSAEALPLVEAFERENSWMSHWRAAVPWLYWDAGEPDIAQILFERIQPEQYAEMACEPGGGQAIAMSCELAARLGDKDRAEALYEVAVPAANGCAVIGYGVGYFGSMARYVGLVAATTGRRSEALDLLTRAVADETARRALSWRAYALADLSRLLHTLGADVGDSRSRLTDLLPRVHRTPLKRAERALRETLEFVH
jgi:predicted ATPase/DNA-binding winged helix-turn-helix (wHTH) protein